MNSFEYIKETNDVLREQKRKAQQTLKAIRLGDTHIEYEDFAREHSLQTVIQLSAIRKKHYGI